MNEFPVIMMQFNICNAGAIVKKTRVLLINAHFILKYRTGKAAI